MARPKEFVRADALKKALLVFWRKGFEAATLPDLTEGMGISRSSLYETFGDKEGLYREALRLYSDEIAAKVVESLRSATTTREGLGHFLRTRVADAMKPRSPGGCLYTYAAAQGSWACQGVRATLKDRAEKTERELEALIRRGQKSREISAKKDAPALARAFELMAFGIDVMARMNPCRARCDRAVEAALALLD